MRARARKVRQKHAKREAMAHMHEHMHRHVLACAHATRACSGRSRAARLNTVAAQRRVTNGARLIEYVNECAVVVDRSHTRAEAIVLFLRHSSLC